MSQTYALITRASFGIGEAFARVLARARIADVVTGVPNKVMAISSRFIPRVIMLEIFGPVFERMYGRQKKKSVLQRTG